MRNPDPDGAGVGNFTPPPSLSQVNVGAKDYDPVGANDGDLYYNPNANSLRVYDYTSASWLNVPAVITGTTVPSVVPTYVGETFLDTTNKRKYVSTGITATTDWAPLPFTNTSNTFTAGPQVIKVGNDVNRGIDIWRNSPTQSGELLTLYKSDGTSVLAQFNAKGALTLSPDAGTAATINGAASSATTLQVNPAAGSVALVIKAGDTNTEIVRIRNTADTTNLFNITDSGKVGVGNTVTGLSPQPMAVVSPASATTVGLYVRGYGTGGTYSQTADLQRWASYDGTTNTTVAYVTSAGNIVGNSTISTINLNARIGETASTGYVRLQRGANALTAPGANLGLLYFRPSADTTSTNLRLVTIAGTGGGETTLFENIDTSAGASNGFSIPLAINALSTTTYTLVSSDAGKNIETVSTSVTSTVSIPLNSSVAYPIGTQITFVQTGTGPVKIITASTGTTLNFYSPTATTTALLKGQWAAATAIKRATDTWVLIGNLT